jgi:hypothetical protein
MMLVLSAFISIAAFAGTSILFGAFLAGAFLTYLPSKHPEGLIVVRVGKKANARKTSRQLSYTPLSATVWIPSSTS